MPEKFNAVLLYGNGDQYSDYRQLIGGLETLGFRMPNYFMDWSVNLDDPTKFGPRSWAGQTHKKTGNTRFQVIIGHSYGGPSAIQYAADQIERGNPPDQLLVCSPAACHVESLRHQDVSDEVRGRHKGVVPAGFQEYSLQPAVDIVRGAMRPEQIDVFIGEEELEEPSYMGRNAEEVAGFLGLPGATVIPGAGHNIDEYDIYVSTIIEKVAVRLL
jgi:hypothetical protein